MENWFRKVFTAMLILIWVQMGFYMEIGGPTMLDLRINLDCDLEDVARCVSAVGTGIFFGALIAGIFVDFCGEWKLLLVTGAALLSSVTVICMAFVNNLTWLWMTFFFLGTSSGLTNVAGQRIVLELWKEKSASPMHALHMGFGIGALAAPLIINPFLAVLDFSKPQTDNGTNVTTSSVNTEEEFVIVEQSRVHLGFITIGVIVIFLSLPFFIYPFIKYFRRVKDIEYSNMDDDGVSQTMTFEDRKIKCLNMINPATYADGSFMFGLFVFVMVFLYFLNIVGGEQLFGNFIRTFSVDELHFTRNEASYLDTVYWGFFTIGRFTGAVLAHFASIRSLFVADMFLFLLISTLADIFAAKSKGTLWAFSALVGLFIGPLYPACVSYTNAQIEVGGVVLTLILFATGFGQLFYVWIEGALYDAHGPRTVLYAIQASAIVICAIVIVYVIVSNRRGDRFTRAANRRLNNITESIHYAQDELSDPQVD